MINRSSAAASRLISRLTGRSGETVTISNGTDSDTVTVTFGHDLLALADADGGMRVEWTEADFLLASADWTDALSELPVRGNTVAWVSGGSTYTFAVCAPDGEPEYRFVDPFRTILRVHGKLRSVD